MANSYRVSHRLRDYALADEFKAACEEVVARMRSRLSKSLEIGLIRGVKDGFGSGLRDFYLGGFERC